MSDQQGISAGSIVIHVLASVTVAVFMAERLSAGQGITISPEVTAALGMSAVGIGSAVLFKWRQRRAARGLTTGQMLAERLAEVARREAEVDAVHARLAELEERLDFSERLLAQGRSAESAERGAHR